MFRANPYGGIALYKNCHEHAATDARQVPRRQGADRNLIERNHFELQPFGIWIASRQGKDLRGMRCGDPYYAEKFVLDRAQLNVVTGNDFRDVDLGVIVEDDRNQVTGNAFHRIREACVRVGSGPRARLLGLPVTDVEVNGNHCARATAGNGGQIGERADGIEYLHGSASSARQETAR